MIYASLWFPMHRACLAQDLPTLSPLPPATLPPTAAPLPQLNMPPLGAQAESNRHGWGWRSRGLVLIMVVNDR